MSEPAKTEEYCEECFELHKNCTCPCPQCGGNEDPFWCWWQSACFDDLCHGGEVPCMHGYTGRLPCGLCGE